MVFDYAACMELAHRRLSFYNDRYVESKFF
jgi:hypothetical protein